MKPLDRAKERLAGVLTPSERRELSLAMLADIAQAALGFDFAQDISAGRDAAPGASKARTFDAVWVLCSDEDAAKTAVEAGAEPVEDLTPGEGLNASLASVTTRVIEAGATGMLIASADCPTVRPEDLAALALGKGVTMATDRAGVGTNALWRQAPDIIPTHFGPDSRSAHSGTAYGNQIPFALIPNERLAVDIDNPTDLEVAARMGVGPRTTDVLARLGYPGRGR